MYIDNALKGHAKELAYLINLAGEGIPLRLWQDMAECDETPMEVGARRAAREDGSFSYQNARICSDDGKLLGMIIAYRLPDPYVIEELSTYPALVQPLIRLEARAAGSWYVNAVATYEEHRGKGVARMLMAEAEAMAREAGCLAISLIVASENLAAKRLYEHLGYRERASLPVVTYPGCLHGGNWLLMSKQLARC